MENATHNKPVSWLIRTVYDVSADKTAKGRFSAQVRLLAATWRYWVDDTAATPLEIVCVGGEAPDTVGALASLGVRLLTSARAPASVVGGTPNKLAGLLISNDEVPVLLIDNDCAFTGPLTLPPTAKRAEVMASIAGNAVVATAQWDVIADAVGARPRQQEWIPLVEECSAAAQQRTAQKNTNLYLNSGVVFVRQPQSFGTQWDRWIQKIAAVFEQHPLRSAAVCNEDQVGFAIAASGVEVFEVMPVQWNYRPPCFWLARAETESIRIVHLTAMRSDAQAGLRVMLNRFWQERVLKPGGPAKGLIMSKSARDAAEKVRYLLLDCVAAYLPEEMT